MPTRLRYLLRSRVPLWLRSALRLVRSGGLKSETATVSFSQEGEDLLLARLFDGQQSGFFVDVGAHHPTRFSNTYLLYLRGWNGINIDPTPGCMKEFDRLRPRDTNLEVAVSSVAGVGSLYIFDEPALNSLDESLSRERDRNSTYRYRDSAEVPTFPLHLILEQNLPDRVERIDLLTVDVEGHDMEVLRSNDWGRFRPRVVLVELLDSSLDELDEREEIAFLRDHGYSPYAKLVNTVVCRDVMSPN